MAGLVITLKNGKQKVFCTSDQWVTKPGPVTRNNVYLGEWYDAMKPDRFVDTAPFVGIEYCGLSWESAFVFLQNALWIHYGDTDLVKEMYKLDQGATTIWETWKESDNTFSQNHPMFGSVSEWYLKWLGGIQPDPENPGKKSVILKPRPVMNLDSLSVEKYFPSGALTSRWWWKERNLCFEFIIPDGLTVNWIPASGNQEIMVRQSPEGWDFARNRKPQGINLGNAGRYIFEIFASKD